MILSVTGNIYIGRYFSGYVGMKFLLGTITWPLRKIFKIRITGAAVMARSQSELAAELPEHNKLVRPQYRHANLRGGKGRLQHKPDCEACQNP